MEILEAFNQALYLRINGTTATPAWQVHAALLIADYLIGLIPLLLVGMWLSGDERRRELAIRGCLVAMLALGANQLIGLVWQHPRPFMIGLGHTFLPHAPDPSFPSDHCTVFSAIALTLLLGRMRWLGGVTLDEVVAACLREQVARTLSVGQASIARRNLHRRPTFERIKELIRDAMKRDPQLATAFREGTHQTSSDLESLYDDLVLMGKIPPDDESV